MYRSAKNVILFPSFTFSFADALEFVRRMDLTSLLVIGGSFLDALTFLLATLFSRHKCSLLLVFSRVIDLLWVLLVVDEVGMMYSTLLIVDDCKLMK